MVNFYTGYCSNIIQPLNVFSNSTYNFDKYNSEESGCYKPMIRMEVN